MVKCTADASDCIHVERLACELEGVWVGEAPLHMSPGRPPAWWVELGEASPTADAACASPCFLSSSRPLLPTIVVRRDMPGIPPSPRSACSHPKWPSAFLNHPAHALPARHHFQAGDAKPGYAAGYISPAATLAASGGGLIMTEERDGMLQCWHVDSKPQL